MATKAKAPRRRVYTTTNRKGFVVVIMQAGYFTGLLRQDERRKKGLTVGRKQAGTVFPTLGTANDRLSEFLDSGADSARRYVGIVQAVGDREMDSVRK